MTMTTSRRSILAGAAALPALAISTSVISTDPVFEAIERHKEAAAAYERYNDNYESDDECDRLAEIEGAALVALLSTTPLTLRGCSAVLTYVNTAAAKSNPNGDDRLFATYKRGSAIGDAASGFMARVGAAAVQS